MIDGLVDAIKRQRIAALKHSQIVKAFAGMSPDPYMTLRALCSKEGFLWTPAPGDPSVTLVQLGPKGAAALTMYVQDQIAYSGSASVAFDVAERALERKRWQAQQWIESYAAEAGLDWHSDIAGNRWILQPVRT